jgi:polyketide synthase 12
VTEPLVSIGAPRAERADAARNRQHLLATARAMLADPGAAALTMDALAERAGLGKGTVFRRFGSRAGIFQALLDDDERAFQEQVLSGPPPLGPGAPPLDRLIAYGQARIDFLLRNREIARHALDGSQPIPAGSSSPLSRLHIRSLLAQLDLGPADLDVLALQLTAALDGPLLLYLSTEALDPPAPAPAPGPGPGPGHPAPLDRVSRGWQDLITRIATPNPS